MKDLFIASIEDDEDDVILLTECLKKLGLFAIKNFGTAQQFLDYPLNGSLPCLFAIDLNLPDIRGLELVELIRSNSIFTDIPVIIYTSTYSRHDARDCEALNISLLTKPETLQEWDKIASIMLQSCLTI